MANGHAQMYQWYLRVVNSISLQDIGPLLSRRSDQVQKQVDVSKTCCCSVGHEPSPGVGNKPFGDSRIKETIGDGGCLGVIPILIPCLKQQESQGVASDLPKWT